MGTQAQGSNRLWPAAWATDSYAVVDRLRRTHHPEAADTTRYPLRLLRYWFMRHLIEAHAARLGRRLNVLEIGVHLGQMLTFMEPEEGRPPGIVQQWDAVDIDADAGRLRALGYADYIEMDLEGGRRPPLTRRYDVMIFLHVLEHLRQPEACVRAFLPFLAADGTVIGGAPTMPKLVADAGYEKRLADTARPFGHVSILSPERIELLADDMELDLTFLSGAFLARNSGSAIENSKLWLRANLAFGALFPSLGSEVYFALERRST